MQIFMQTNDMARELGVSEARVRRMVKRGELSNSAQTRRGDALFSDADVSRAKSNLALARRRGRSQ